MTTLQVAKVFGVSRQTIYRWCALKKIPYVKIDKVIRIPEWWVRETQETGFAAQI